LSGIIACQIIDGQFDVAKEQLDFLKGETTRKNLISVLLYLFVPYSDAVFTY